MAGADDDPQAPERVSGEASSVARPTLEPTVGRLASESKRSFEAR